MESGSAPDLKRNSYHANTARARLDEVKYLLSEQINHDPPEKVCDFWNSLTSLWKFFWRQPGLALGIIIRRDPSALYLQTMKLTYRIEKKDHYAFQWHHILRSGNAWRQYSVVLILGILAMSYEFFIRETEFQTAVTFIVGYILLMVLTFFVSTYISIKSAIRRNYSGDNNGVVGDHCFIVDDTAVCEQAGPVETKVKWIGIHKISVGEDHAFIYYNSQAAFIVPKRAFVDESEFNTFVRDCVSRLPELTLNPRL